MGYDLLEDNELAALDNSRTDFKFINDGHLPVTKKMTTIKFNIIDGIERKYSSDIQSCEQAESIISKIDKELNKLYSKINENKDSVGRNFMSNKSTFFINTKIKALKQKREELSRENVRLKCIDEMKKQEDDYNNSTEKIINKAKNVNISENMKYAIVGFSIVLLLIVLTDK